VADEHRHELTRIFAALSTPTLETVADEFSRAMEHGRRPYLRPAADAVRTILVTRGGDHE
jgi:hypothetical protein